MITRLYLHTVQSHNYCVLSSWFSIKLTKLLLTMLHSPVTGHMRQSAGIFTNGSSVPHSKYNIMCGLKDSRVLRDI